MDIEQGQFWTRKNGNGNTIGRDRITTLLDVSTPDDFEIWEVQYDNGGVTTLSGDYIQRQFEYQGEHTPTLKFTDFDGDTLYVNRGTFNPSTAVFEIKGQRVALHPKDLDELTNWLNVQRTVYRGESHGRIIGTAVHRIQGHC